MVSFEWVVAADLVFAGFVAGIGIYWGRRILPPRRISPAAPDYSKSGGYGLDAKSVKRLLNLMSVRTTKTVAVPGVSRT
ncbi:MAG: hypothetical protein HY244_17840 [Rhizobiales bacterium]|nr:hypothetical protein [Hyphomicrobiales bacterium]